MPRFSRLLVSSILAGFCIGLGGTVFLRLKGVFPGSDVIGALLFTVGLFTVCTRGYALYTGRSCYVFDNRLAYLADLLVVWIGNFLGCILIAWLESLTSICAGSGIDAAGAAIATVKLANSPLSLFVLGAFCNIFIFIGVNGYASNPHECGKYLALIFGVMCFIVAGTEHCVADMYFFAVSGALYERPAEVLPALALVSLGNLAGGASFPLIEKLMARLPA